LLDHRTELLIGARTYRSAFTRVLGWANEYFPPALATGAAVCLKCGSLAPLRLGQPSFMRRQGLDVAAVHIDCSCWELNTCDLPFLALASPVGRAFRQAHPRMRLISELPQEVTGGDALVIAFADSADTARLTLTVARDTYRVIEIAAT